jgi:hypothetical protein
MACGGWLWQRSEHAARWWARPCAVARHLSVHACTWPVAAAAAGGGMRQQQVARARAEAVRANDRWARLEFKIQMKSNSSPN